MAKERNIIPIDKLLPMVLNVIPLGGRPIFPGVFTPMVITDPEDVTAINLAMANDDGFIGFMLLKNDNETPSYKDLYTVGTVAKIVKKVNLPDGGVNVLVSTYKRFICKKLLNKQNPIRVLVEYVADKNNQSMEVKALLRSLIGEMQQISKDNPLFTDEMRFNLVNIDQAGKAADFIASILNISKDEQQEVLACFDVKERMEKVFLHIQKEKEFLNLQRKIQEDLNARIEKNQREYFLREELRSIKEELGLSSDPKTMDLEKFRKKIDEFKFEGEVKETVESEYQKLSLMEVSSPDYGITHTYLETILSLPWNSEPQNDYDLTKAEKILNSDHYGLEDVKERIVEYLAVRKLKKDNKGAIILLVGPPGVGKTSVGRSIARAMNKPFFRFSVGGMRDEAEIKGHRRTYIGAMPGKILQGLKITKNKGPVFVIDEVDKMQQSHNGDPASALLEVLDPEQNVNFRDHYLDLPFDLSDIVFILTANTLTTIPSPLLDRAEIIRLSGYVDDEKVQIAKKFLIPKSLEKHGLLKKSISYTSKMLLSIANNYARESGVRNLEKKLDKIHRKLATQIVKGKREANDTLKVTDEVILDMLGKPIFDEEEFVANIAGTSIGLAWTRLGGATLPIESTITPGKGALKITGRLGDVMKESASIAWSWARKYAIDNKIKEPRWFENMIVHLHFPEGAIPKDGPSAGIAMVTAFVSLLTGKTIKPRLAMTGEVSLTGNVLKIGGLKEKTIGGKRNGIKEIIIPKGNLRDVEEIPDNVKKGITFYPVSTMNEVLDIAFDKKLNIGKI